MSGFVLYYLLFIFYSFAGWIIESSFRSATEKEGIINSGFLKGPFIPVYGFGGILTLGLKHLVQGLSFPFQLAVFTLMATVLEYWTSVMLEKLFNTRLWDYSSYPLNLKGRVCLLFSSFWALLIWLQLSYLQPLVSSGIEHVPGIYRLVFASFFTLYLSVDIVFSVKVYLRFTTFLSSIQNLKMLKISKGLRTRVQHLHPLHEMKEFIRPLKAFPYLREQLSVAVFRMPGISGISFVRDINTILRNRLSQLNSRNTGGDMREFNQLCKGITDNPEYRKLKNIKHHDKDIYSHNIKVAWVAFLAGKKLRLKVKDIVRGALLHDLFFYDWRTERDPGYFLPHGFTHPVISRKNAERIFGELSSIEKDIITKHMWPLTLIPPRYPESMLVSLVDKVVAGREAVSAVSGIIPGKSGRRLKKSDASANGKNSSPENSVGPGDSGS